MVTASEERFGKNLHWAPPEDPANLWNAIAARWLTTAVMAMTWNPRGLPGPPTERRASSH